MERKKQYAQSRLQAAPVGFADIRLRFDLDAPGVDPATWPDRLRALLARRDDLQAKIDETTAIVPGLDGKKMSKSYGNAIALREDKKPGEGDFTPIDANRYPAPANSEVLLNTGTGGGWGDPLDRDPAKVQADVDNGDVSEKSAKAIYGVVLGNDKATARERKNIFAALMSAVKTHSLGQISHALYEVGGEYRRNM